MLNLESIRNASFSLMPTGYNPEAVDANLHDLAETLAAGGDITDAVSAVVFDITDVGYSTAEVDEYFAGLAEACAGTASDQPVEAFVSTSRVGPPVPPRAFHEDCYLIRLLCVCPRVDLRNRWPLEALNHVLLNIVDDHRQVERGPLNRLLVGK